MLWSLLFFSLIASFNTESIQLSGTKINQSSFYEHDDEKYTSERAIDEDVQISVNTLDKMNSWWRIDMMGVYRINSIEIFHKKSSHSDINGAEIYTGYSPQCNRTAGLKFETIGNFQIEHWNTFIGNGNVSGRYITVIYPKKKHLILCKVKINGTKEESPFVLIQESKTWEEALSYCRAEKLDLASILDAKTQTMVELEAMNATTEKGSIFGPKRKLNSRLISSVKSERNHCCCLFSGLILIWIRFSSGNIVFQQIILQ